MTPNAFATAMQATWPPLVTKSLGPWLIRTGAGGGKRVSAASAAGACTAALPDDAQDSLYRLLKEKLPRTTFVSIGHREGVAQFHDRRFRWQGQVLSPG